MTNYEKWMEYTSGLSSPNNYIQWTWRFIVGAALQRRVWMPPDHKPVYGNSYTILTGKAGLGKGLPIGEANTFFYHWKLEDHLKAYSNNGCSEDRKNAAEMINKSDLVQATQDEQQSKNKEVTPSKALLIPMAPDDITYEALVGAICKSYRRISYPKWDEVNKKHIIGHYGHSSLVFALPELASLLRQRTNDTVNFLLGLYDCPEDYKYVTKTRGEDRIRRGCLSLFAGTTPNFMSQIFNEKLIDQGFSSRCWFIYAEEDRQEQFWIPGLTAQQEQYKKELLEHILKLTTLYGRVEISEKVHHNLELWWKENSKKRANKSPKLDAYYGRKKVHILKVAMMEHFSEHASMEEMSIPWETFEKATKVLEEEEPRMDLAIVLQSNNPLSIVYDKIKQYLKTGGKNYVDILIEMGNYGKKQDIDDSLDYLEMTGQIKKANENEEVVWKLTKT